MRNNILCICLWKIEQQLFVLILGHHPIQGFDLLLQYRDELDPMYNYVFAVKQITFLFRL